MSAKLNKKFKNSALNNTTTSRSFPGVFWTTSALLALGSLLASCASSDAGKDRAELCRSKSESTQKRFDDGKYWQIKEDLEEILSKCHGTGYIEQAQYLLAESHFHLEEWIEARGEYGSFSMSFPGSPFAEAATYRRAVSAFKMSYRDSRDDGNTHQAITDFQEFRDNWPSSGLLDSAAFFIAELRERLALKEFQTARLYWRMKEPQASAIYLKLLLDEYPQSRYRRDAHLLLIDSYIRLDQFEQAQLHIEKFLAEITDKEAAQEAEKRHANMSEARKRYEARILKEQRKKLQRKDDEG